MQAKREEVVRKLIDYDSLQVEASELPSRQLVIDQNKQAIEASNAKLQEIHRQNRGQEKCEEGKGGEEGKTQTLTELLKLVGELQEQINELHRHHEHLSKRINKESQIDYNQLSWGDGPVGVDGCAAVAGVGGFDPADGGEDGPWQSGALFGFVYETRQQDGWYVFNRFKRWVGVRGGRGAKAERDNDETEDRESHWDQRAGDECRGPADCFHEWPVSQAGAGAAGSSDGGVSGAVRAESVVVTFD